MPAPGTERPRPDVYQLLVEDDLCSPGARIRAGVPDGCRIHEHHAGSASRTGARPCRHAWVHSFCGLPAGLPLRSVRWAAEPAGGRERQVASPQGAWARALLQLCLLGVLEPEGPSYGHALPGRLPAAGLDTVKPATLYPALARLAEEGMVEIGWAAGEGGPGRKYYSTTEQGRARLGEQRRAWGNFKTTVTAPAEGGRNGGRDNGNPVGTQGGREAGCHLHASPRHGVTNSLILAGFWALVLSVMHWLRDGPWAEVSSASLVGIGALIAGALAGCLVGALRTAGRVQAARACASAAVTAVVAGIAALVMLPRHGLFALPVSVLVAVSAMVMAGVHKLPDATAGRWFTRLRSEDSW
ncbi:PadR family transcriptional regulator (plasmid) [Streptomyces sp. CG4]|uniref:PadR family transcriptional regulator n=1 Tax=Streptomyces sp. CG4 TaxID=408783 RepID=UPI0034E21DF1